MYDESIVEKGIVLSTNGELAEVALLESGSCKECSAKIFCKPSEKNQKVLEVEDPFGVQKGDEVRIKIPGGAIFKASVMLYGMPLLLIIVGIISGMSLFRSTSLPELFSFIFGLGLTALYIASLFLFKHVKKNQPTLPKITFVKRP